MSAKQKTKPTTKNTFRTPIVAVMGHVDHGKTSILDAIRGTRVQAKEEGGITQNTRAHQITTKSGNKITFVDTPGHEAFSTMRSRGAQMTDFVMLVVAADDGIQNQTKQSIKFAKETGSPIIVVINKVDIEGVKIEKVKQELASFDVQIEEYGGDALCFEVSATKKTGLDELIEGIELLAEVQGLASHKSKEGTLAEAYVLESSIDKRVGSVALCVLKAGSLDQRGFGVTADEYFRVRAYLDQDQKPLNSVSESDPFWVTGPRKPINAGETIYFVNEEKQARELHARLEIETKTEETKEEEAKLSKDMIFMQMIMQEEAKEQGTEPKLLNLIVKSSTVGTLEAVRAELEKFNKQEKRVNVLEASTGEITESDIKRAKLAKGIVVSFQLPVPSNIDKIARQERVLVRNYQIIYEMVDELEGAIEALIEPEEIEVEVARARIKQVFKLTNGDIVAGAEVIKGILLKGYRIYVERPSESTKDEIAEIGRGKITALRILKNEVKEVKKGQECGILIDPKIETLAEGDEVVAYKVEQA